MNSHTNSLIVVVDDREQRSGVEEALRLLPDVEVRRERLAVGDYCVDERILFERKSAADFGQSLLSGRLFAQASRMVRTPYRPAYILEGTAAAWNASGISREALQGALVSLMLIFDLPVIRSSGAAETARLILYAGRQSMRARAGGDAAWQVVKAKRKATRQRRLLQVLPGIGTARAKVLLAHFGTVRACLEASEEELRQVKGVGAHTARAIIETVNEPRASYGSRLRNPSGWPGRVEPLPTHWAWRKVSSPCAHRSSGALLAASFSSGRIRCWQRQRPVSLALTRQQQVATAGHRPITRQRVASVRPKWALTRPAARGPVSHIADRPVCRVLH